MNRVKKKVLGLYVEGSGIGNMIERLVAASGKHVKLSELRKIATAKGTRGTANPEKRVLATGREQKDNFTYNWNEAGYGVALQLKPHMQELVDKHGVLFPPGLLSGITPPAAPGETGKSKASRTTLILDDSLIETARRFGGIREKTALIHAALKTFIEREAGLKLAAMGGTMPGLQPIPRRRLPAQAQARNSA